MSTEVENPIPLLDEVKLQAQVLIPILRTLRTEMGKDKADELVAKSLSDWVRSVYLRIGEKQSGAPREKWQGVWNELRPRIGGVVERELLRDDNDARDYNVNRCGFAEFFKTLGEPELGALLVCDFDYYVAEVGAPTVELTRTQTIMKGAAYCDFRYRFKRG